MAVQGAVEVEEVSDLDARDLISTLRQFYMTLPLELDVAAKIDGCGYFGIYADIILPLSKPALATVAISPFFETWNSFQRLLTYLISPPRSPQDRLWMGRL